MTSNALPNVIFIVADQLKATALQMYSEIGVPTPSLERMANEGVMYRHAVTPHALCVPARVSMMTGRYAHSTGARRNETLMPSGQLHAFRIWKELGYTTGLIGKNHCFIEQDDVDLLDVRCEMSHGGLPRSNYKGEIPGIKGMEWVVPREVINEAHSTRNNMPEQSRSFGYAVTDHPIEGYSTAALTIQTKAFIDRFGSPNDDPDRKPFALLLSYPDPHHPLEAPRKYADMIPPESIVTPPQRSDEYTDGTIPTRNRQLHDMLGVSVDDPKHVRNAMAVYMAMTRFVDDAVGEVLDHLDETGLRENTIVVFTADHGDFNGEHDMLGKGGVFYDALTRVPMLVSWPAGGVPCGRVDDSMANTIDLLPTILQLSRVADFSASPDGEDIDELLRPGPRVLHDNDSSVINSESLRRIQGRPLPTATDSPPRSAAFSEYGTGGTALTDEAMHELMDQGHQGRDLLMETLWIREAEGRRRMVRTKDWKFVTDPGSDDLDELYDLNTDPWELTNVANDPANIPVISKMRALLMEWATATEDYDPVPLPTTLGRLVYIESEGRWGTARG
ncbi:MAG: sulfatase-like hydrolase/transferase [Chloroflexi bacterium]|nr:sulfatase-like hydrolase/transferase [Chloroflexota bacterium]MYK61524.1 sulfatase-like hydrolase/transferase [Chloroflexota bacterium]